MEEGMVVAIDTTSRRSRQEIVIGVLGGLAAAAAALGPELP
jgi:hypothetical protein